MHYSYLPGKKTDSIVRRGETSMHITDSSGMAREVYGKWEAVVRGGAVEKRGDDGGFE